MTIQYYIIVIIWTFFFFVKFEFFNLIVTFYYQQFVVLGFWRCAWAKLQWMPSHCPRTEARTWMNCVLSFWLLPHLQVTLLIWGSETNRTSNWNLKVFRKRKRSKQSRCLLMAEDSSFLLEDWVAMKSQLLSFIWMIHGFISFMKSPKKPLMRFSKSRLKLARRYDDWRYFKSYIRYVQRINSFISIFI